MAILTQFFYVNFYRRYQNFLYISIVKLKTLKDMRITNEQKTVTSNAAIGFLKENVGYNMDDAITITENILDDVVEDIECTADWSNLKHDEVNLWDVELAVKRVIYDRIINS